MKHKVRKWLAYILVPITFTVIGYAVIYLICAPILDVAGSALQIFMADKKPQFTTELSSIFVPPEHLEAQNETILLADIKWPEAGQQYGELTCPAIGIDVPVYYGDSSEILQEGAGQYQGSFIPGYGRTILIAGHRLTYFTGLADAKKGDVFTFTTSYGVYKYRVRKVKILDHEDPKAFDLTREKEELILYTCHSLNPLAGVATDRVFVYAEKTSGPDLK